MFVTSSLNYGAKKRLVTDTDGVAINFFGLGGLDLHGLVMCAWGGEGEKKNMLATMRDTLRAVY